MESGNRAAVGQDLRTLWDGGATGPLDDGELLARFLGGGEGAETAFAALVERHARMVLRVCRSVLGDPHDAQDSAQATFLVLARRAGSIRKPGALPSWLHGTARRVATRALRDAVTRRRHERRSVEHRPESGEPARSWPELHEEIDRLPDRYRAAIVLCDLSGLTHEQAAGQLGCPARTLQTRLYRGRERLKDRLVRRGVAPAVVAAVLASGSEAPAAGPSWVASTAGLARALAGSAGWSAAGEASARIARSYLKGMKMANLRAALATALLLGLAGGGALSVFARGREEAPQVPSGTPVAEVPPKGKPVDDEPATHPITVTGRATDLDGRPVANARITLASHKARFERVAEVTTNADGRYEFRAVRLPIEPPGAEFGVGTGSFQVFGVAEGFGIAWRPQKFYDPKPTPPNVTREPALFDPPSRYEADDKIELDLRFPPAARITGSVLRGDGSPLFGARLRIYDCEYLKVPDQFAFESKLDMLNGSVRLKLCRKTTDAQGRFSFDDLPADCRVRVGFTATGYPDRMFLIATSAGPQPDFQGASVLSGDLEIRMPTPVVVPVRITRGDSGLPAPRVRVEGAGKWGNSSGTTDDQGLVTLLLPKGEYAMEILPALGTPYLLTEKRFEVKEAMPTGPLVFPLDPAAIVEVSAIDEETGKGVPGVDVWRGRNPDGRPERYYFRSWEVATRVAHVTYPKTDADGKARVLFRPGKHRIGVGNESRPRWTTIVEGGQGQDVECRAGETLAISFHFRKVPRNVAPKPEPARPGTHPVTVQGRAVDPDGNPVANARITLASTAPSHSSKVAETRTGPDGRYEFRDAPLPIEPSTTNNGRDQGSFQVFGQAAGLGFAWRPSKSFYPEAAQEKGGVPTPQFDPPGAFEPGDKIDLDLKFTRADRLQGTVTDEKGGPLAGVRLELYDCVVPEVQNCIGCWSLDILNRAVPDSMRVRTTDAAGRFEFNDMPEGCRFRIILRAKGRPDRTVYAGTFDVAQPDYDNSPVLTGDLKIALSSAVSVVVRLVHGDTGRPAEKAFVQAGGSFDVTDKDGRATLHLSPGPYTMQNWPAVDTPYLVSGGKLDVGAQSPAGPVPATLDPAAFVEMTVVEAETGRGIADVDIWREQGENVDERTDIVSRKAIIVRSFEAPTLVRRDRPRTDAGGKARFPIEPGKQRIGVGRESFPPGREVVEAAGQDVECKAGETTSLRFTLRKKP